MIKSIVFEVFLVLFYQVFMCNNTIIEEKYEEIPPKYYEVEQLLNYELSYELINSNYEKLVTKGYKVTYNPGAIKIEKDELDVLLFTSNPERSSDIAEEYPIFIYEIKNYGEVEEHYLLYSDYNLSIDIKYETEAYSGESLVYNDLIDFYNDLLD